MKSSLRRSVLPVLATLITLSVTGCLDPRFTRMPRLNAAHPVSENKAFELTDPFPDPDAGPDTLARPRGYMTPRTESHRAAQQRLLNSLLNDPQTIPPYRDSQRQYPNAVQ